MKGYFLFAIYNCIGVFCIISVFPDMSIKQILGLILGIQLIATGLDFLDYIDKKG